MSCFGRFYHLAVQEATQKFLKFDLSAFYYNLSYVCKIALPVGHSEGRLPLHPTCKDRFL